MKKVITFTATAIAAVSAVSSMAFAKGVPDAPHVHFTGRTVTVLEVCLADHDTLRTKVPATYYEWDGDNHRGPSRKGPALLYTSRHYYKTYPEGDGTKEVLQSYPLTYKLNLISEDSYRSDVEHIIGTMDYTIPACE